jgi:Do/DeqQ family serine protease
LSGLFSTLVTAVKPTAGGHKVSRLPFIIKADEVIGRRNANTGHGPVDADCRPRKRRAASILPKLKAFVRRAMCAVATAALIAAPLASGQPAIDNPRSALPTLAPLLDEITPAVVNISIQSRSTLKDSPFLRDPFFRRLFNLPEEENDVSAGSGVIVDVREGLVLTNYHVIRNAEEIVVTLKDGRQFHARPIGADHPTDVAVLKIDVTNLVALKLGDSDRLRVGDFVLAIGNPFGLGQTVTSGIVSALGRSGFNVEGYEDFIQTDASINPGNSGGALVNLRGELVGVNTSIVGPSGGNFGIGFAVPVNMARAVMSQIMRFGEVRRGRLGIKMEALSVAARRKLKLPVANGALVSEVQPGSPAEQAGLRRGDVVMSFDGRPVRDSNDFRNRIGLTPIGDHVELTILRKGQQLAIRAQIAPPLELPLIEGRVVPQLSGLRVADPDRITPKFARFEGALVVAVDDGSVAAKFGLHVGDAVTAVNRRRVRNVADFLAALHSVDHGFSLSVIRGDQAISLLPR